MWEIIVITNIKNIIFIYSEMNFISWHFHFTHKRILILDPLRSSTLLFIDVIKLPKEHVYC